MIRYGLCCIFRDEPVRFRRTTARHLLTLPPEERSWFLARLCKSNATALADALNACHRLGIGAFRVNSQILPLATHPQLGYRLAELPDGPAVIAAFRHCGQKARQWNIRLSFHPDQFVVLNSPRADVRAASIRELEYQTEVAIWIGADVINIHGGGVYGDPAVALCRLRSAIEGLPEAIRLRLSLENDDRAFRPAQLLPVCQATGLPFVYDVHHHRCLPDGHSIEETTEAALATWTREPLFHLSSPLDGWNGSDPRRHADFIDPADFPAAWHSLDFTLDVEAKAKEAALLRLRESLNR